mgnify:CR=1 FL=1
MHFLHEKRKYRNKKIAIFCAPLIHVNHAPSNRVLEISATLKQRYGYELKIFPAKTSCQEILNFKPNGVFLSNGPGDPEPCIYAIETIKELIQISMPIFGICLGHQLLAIALGGKTSKMKFGHHGANHPVQDLKTRKVSVSSQNHGFTVEENSLPTNVEITHKSLFDGTIQGIQHSSKPFFSFQGHPEASPGPHDLAYLFTTFDKNMTKNA